MTIPSPEALRLEDVRFTYRSGERPALDGISLEIAKGEAVRLLGASGSGRSTLALTPNRIVPLHHRGTFSGTVRLFGEPVAGRPIAELAGTVGQVFQDFESQIFGTRVDLEAAFGCENLGVPRDEMRPRVHEALERVGLAGFEARDPATLSGGEKQRLAIASVLAMKPRLLVLDEPATDLDPLGREAVWALLGELREEGRTLLVVEPEAEEALAGRWVVLRDGRVALDGPAETSLRDPARLESLGIRPPDLARLASRLGLAPVLHSGKSVPVPDPVGVMTERIRERFVLDTTRIATSRAREPGPVALRLEGVGHSYEGGVEALAPLDLEFREGELVAIVGANGSGKTTAALAASGLLAARRGRVLLRGRDLRGLPAERRGREIGFVFQNPDQQIFAATVGEEVGFAARNFGASEEAARRSVADALEIVGLPGAEAKDPFVLTRGDRQRVAVASVLAAGPRLLVLDEPTTGLDPADQQRMMGLLAGLRDAGCTILIVTHAIGLACAWSDRLIVLDRGRLVADGPVREVMASAALERDSAVRRPSVVRLALRLGAPLLSVDELAAALRVRA